MNPHIEEFLEDVQAANSTNTYKVRKSDLGKYEEWLQEQDIDVLEASPRNVHRYLRQASAELSDNTVRRRITSINLLYDFLEQWDEIDANPMAELERSDYTNTRSTKKHDKADISYVTKEQVEEMAANVPGPKVRNELLIRLLWQTGVRRSEAATIKLENIDRDNRSIRIWAPKTQEWRTVFYQPSLDSLLRAYLDGGERARFLTAADSEYLFVSRKVAHIRGRQVGRIVRKAASNAGIQSTLYTDAKGEERRAVTAHSIRHGHAVHALKQGINIKVLSKNLGHKSVDVTEQYLRLVDEDVKQEYAKF
ncbi:tyrosine-type recombinase/integrase [Halomicrococcus gelatinilyticus]|uniref:tyrosine-type recombinase/integrase n=1 Tax=Halomicrococcus gelatinilyticus TaxID=1702103 RepID=UPI002E0F59E3